MGTRLFVGNFSFSVNDEQLRDYFGNVGSVVSAKVMTEGEGGRSRGFGFVEMSSEDDAKKAISDLDGSTWDGRIIKVSEDRNQRRGRGGDEASESDSNESEGERVPTGYFRAQPFDIGVKRRRKQDPFEEDEALLIDYKDARLLARFMSDRGRILPRRMTGLTAANQRQVKKAIRRAQHLALLPLVQR